ncbi:TcaA 3rd/4th domain-containing protein [Clostridium thermarum]|uniref:TcaA 3rd/4th domain-containing protein n=2 Tax=Clostridium thermarum TaxID=1716543 RepID=UPI001124B131|nr:zinc-ribbon domain-containing protein [Clostridium thermarum]
MKFCGNCGQQLQEGQRFCQRCGKNLMVVDNNGQVPLSVEPQSVHTDNLGDTQNVPVENTYNYQQNPVSFGGPVPAMNVTKIKAPRKPMGLGLKIAISAIILILLGGGAFFGIGRYITSEGQVVKKIEKAINENDAKELIKYLYSSEEDMKIDEASTEILLKYINKDEYFKEELIEKLSQGRKFENFSMTENGRTLLVFKKYVMEVEPQYLKLSSNYEGVNIKLNGVSIGKSQKDGVVKKYGPFIPGSYKLEFVYENEFGSSVIEEKVELTNNEFSYYADFNLKTVYCYASTDSLKVSVDGMETNMEIGLEGSEIGPFPDDNNRTIVFSKKYPWGNLVSIDYNSDDMFYDFFIEEFKIKDSDFIKSAAPYIKDFIVSYYTAKSSLNKDLLVNATDNCKYEFERNNYWDIPEDYIFNKAYINGEALYVYKDNNTGRDMFTIYVGAEYTFIDYDNRDILTLNMYYDEATGKWMIDSYNTYGYLDNVDLIDLQ